MKRWAAFCRCVGRDPAAGGDICHCHLERSLSRYMAGRSLRRPTSFSPPPCFPRSARACLPALRLFLPTLAIRRRPGGDPHHRALLHRQPSALSLALAGLCIPDRPRHCPHTSPSAVSAGRRRSLGRVLNSGVHATLSGVVLAFCLPRGSGLDLRNLSAAMVRDPVVLGIAVGLFVGKQLGIFAGTGRIALVQLGVLGGRCCRPRWVAPCCG